MGSGRVVPWLALGNEDVRVIRPTEHGDEFEVPGYRHGPALVGTI